MYLRMTKIEESNISFDEVKGVLRDTSDTPFSNIIIKHDDLSNTSLQTIREGLCNHFQKPKGFFDKCKDEVNELIVETLNDMYNKEGVKAEVKFVELPAPEKRPSTSNGSSSTETTPKRGAKELQADIMTKSEFMAKAPKIKVQIEDAVLNIAPKQFSTDSCGWNGSDKIKIEVDGKTFVCQVGLNVTVVGSKQWKA